MTNIDDLLALGEIKVKIKKNKPIIKEAELLEEKTILAEAKWKDIKSLVSLKTYVDAFAKIDITGASEDALKICALLSRIEKFAKDGIKDILPQANKAYLLQKDENGNVCTPSVTAKPYTKNPLWVFSEELTKAMDKIAEDKQKEKDTGVAKAKAAPINMIKDRLFKLSN